MADFRINVIVDPSGARRGGRQVEGQLNRMQGSAERLRRTLSRTVGLLGGGLAVGSLVRTLAEYEQAISTVRAITGATESQFASLREETQRLGATTRFSASQAAEGAQFLARAGFDVNEVLGSLEETLLLAQAGALDLGSAADIASNVLTGFRLPVSDAARVVDVLAFTANNANTDVRQLGDAMKFVAPVAAGLGVPLEEAAAAMASLSNAGLQGSLAGTGLRRVLAELESPANKTRKILGALGVEAEEVRVSQVGLTEAIRRLAEAGLDTGLALEIFGDRGGPAFEVLSNAIDDVEDMTGALGDVGGTARDISEVMDDNLNGALLAVRSAFEAFIIALGEAGATSVLRQALEALAATLRFLADNAETVIQVLEVLLALFVANKILAFAAALRTAAAGVVALELALGAATTRAALFGGALKTIARLGPLAFAAMGGPIGAIIIAVGALLAVIQKVRGEFDALRASAGESVALINDQVNDLRDVAAVQRAIADEEANINRLREEGGNFVRDTLGLTEKEIELRQQAVDAAKEALATRKALIEAGGIPSDGPAGTSIPEVPEGGGLNLEDLESAAGGVKKVNEELERLKDLQRLVTGDREGLGQTAADLQTLFNAGAISAQQFTEAMRDLNVEVSALDNSLSGGIQNGFDRIIQRSNELGSRVSNFVVGAFDKASDAIVDFAKTGELNIRAFFGELAAQLLKIATNQLFSQLLGSAGGGGGLGSLFSGIGGLFGFATGGSAMVAGSGGTDSQLVAFRATPGERVDVSTPRQQQDQGGTTVVQAPAPNVMVNISPRDLTGALSGAEGDEFIVQGIERNARSIRAVLGR